MIDDLITRLLEREGRGKFTDHPADRGGPTKWGITQARWSEYVGYPASVASIRNITEQQARTFYEDQYIIRPGFHKLSSEFLIELLFDCAVNHGEIHAVKWLQRAVRATQDGVIGPRTLAAAEAEHPLRIFLRVNAYRARLYGALVSRDKTLTAAKKAGFRCQAENAAGWNSRLAGFLEAAADDIEALIGG